MNMIYFAIPLIIVFSICYAATRHEDVDKIFRHAVGMSIKLLIVFALAAFLLTMLARG
ncbi:MAG: hypothetical protein LBJ00_01170 [Planctomycetaceae bacterium]|nr:hypothetical protein [Planctomycetaceae bacterium]